MLSLKLRNYVNCQCRSFIEKYTGFLFENVLLFTSNRISQQIVIFAANNLHFQINMTYGQCLGESWLPVTVSLTSSLSVVSCLLALDQDTRESHRSLPETTDCPVIGK